MLLGYLSERSSVSVYFLPCEQLLVDAQDFDSAVACIDPVQGNLWRPVLTIRDH